LVLEEEIRKVRSKRSFLYFLFLEKLMMQDFIAVLHNSFLIRNCYIVLINCY